jgi:anti-sigma regulatory factor (Ser/Thr protein kinase)
MMEDGTLPAQDRLVLRGQLSEMAQLPVWIAALAARHLIPEKVQFVMDLCLEEAVSNVIRHGYAGVEDGSVIIRFTQAHDGRFEFVVEDHARHFNPLDFPDQPAQDMMDEDRIGGRGIRLLRQFAGALAYEAMPEGNRLRIGF